MKNTILVLAILGLALIPEIGSSQTPGNIKKEKTKLVSFTYDMGNYDIEEVNKTRKANSAQGLKRTKTLDSLALIRCKRMADIIARDPDAFCKDDIIFGKEGHKENFTPENVTNNISGAGVKKDSIATLDPKKVYTRLTSGSLVNPGVFLAASNYNGSANHFKNRTNPNHKEYGSCYIAIFVCIKNTDPDGILPYTPKLIIVHYELFR